MQEFLLTHPSLFIITLTIITIMLIYIFRDKIKSKYTKVEDTCVESTCSIEMQEISTLRDPHYDEPDLLAPLPNPKLYKKLRNDYKKPSSKYDVPRIHGIPEAAEPSSSNLPQKINDYKILNNLKTPGSHLENLERRYNFIQLPAVPTIVENNENIKKYTDYSTKTENITNTDDVKIVENAEKTENTYMNEAKAISMQPVVHRVKSNKNTDNRISVSEVHKHGSYVSFDGEFDQFDDLSRRSNVMRMTVNFDPDEPPVYV